MSYQRILKQLSKHALILSLTLLAFSPNATSAEKLCIKKRQRIRNNAVPMGQRVLRVANECPRAFVELLDTDSFKGEDGLPGTEAPSIYGDGSAGNLAVSSNTSFTGLNAQFENITIDAGQTLQLNSGTILRCTGNFVNNGTIEVRIGSLGGMRRESPPTKDFNATRFPHQGLSLIAATQSSYGTDAVIGGAAGGIAQNMNSVIAARLYHGRSPAGSGGSGSLLGGQGGGAVYILCYGSITNRGLIFANGGTAVNGGGGGAGGLIVLASATAVHNTNDGVILASGGDGGGESSNTGGGGGGGGGIIHLAAPTITSAGTTQVTGGSAGNSSGSVTDSPRYGGGGGGAFGGTGGSGATVNNDNTQVAAQAGNDGLVVLNEVDPSGIF